MFRSNHYPPLVGSRRGNDLETLAKIFFLITTLPSGGTDLKIKKKLLRYTQFSLKIFSQKKFIFRNMVRIKSKNYND